MLLKPSLNHFFFFSFPPWRISPAISARVASRIYFHDQSAIFTQAKRKLIGRKSFGNRPRTYVNRMRTHCMEKSNAYFNARLDLRLRSPGSLIISHDSLWLPTLVKFRTLLIIVHASDDVITVRFFYFSAPVRCRGSRFWSINHGTQPDQTLHGKNRLSCAQLFYDCLWCLTIHERL